MARLNSEIDDKLSEYYLGIDQGMFATSGADGFCHRLEVELGQRTSLDDVGDDDEYAWGVDCANQWLDRDIESWDFFDKDKED